MVLTFTCCTQQALEIGEDVEITVVEVAPGEVRLGIRAPGRRVTRLDPVPLPAGSADLRLVHLAGAPGGHARPAASPVGRERREGGKSGEHGERQRQTLAGPVGDETGA